MMNTQPGMVSPQPNMYNLVDVKWSWLMTLGIILVILGGLAIIFPAATSVSITLLLGILLVIGGAGRLVSMFRSKGWGDFFWKMLAAVVYLAAGIMLLAYPLGSTVTLTLVLGLFFIAQGVTNLFVSLMSRDVKGWGLMLFNSLVSFVLGAMIWTDLPSSAAWAIGLLVGIYLLFDGLALIAASWMMHSDENRTVPA